MILKLTREINRKVRSDCTLAFMRFRIFSHSFRYFHLFWKWLRLFGKWFFYFV